MRESTSDPRAAVVARHHVNVRGRGTRPMLFAHGFGCDQGLWSLVAPAFEDSHQVVLFDYVGAGQSDRTAWDPARYATLHGYARDIVDICEALDLRDVVVVGHSVSSMIAMLAAEACPQRIGALVMVAPSPCYLDDGDYRGGFARDDLLGLLQLMDANGMSWSRFLAGTVMGRPDRPELADALEERFCANDPVVLRQFAEATFFSDHRQDLSRCRTPSLLLECRDDALAPEGVGHYMLARMTVATRVRLQATGHCPHVSEPAETIAAMRGWALLHDSAEAPAKGLATA